MGGPAWRELTGGEPPGHIYGVDSRYQMCSVLIEYIPSIIAPPFKNDKRQLALKSQKSVFKG